MTQEEQDFSDEIEEMIDSGAISPEEGGFWLGEEDIY